MLVRDVMQRDLKTVAANVTIADAIDALVEAHVSGLPVVDSFGRAVGVISSRDILAAEHMHGEPGEREFLFDSTLVLEVMQSWPVTVSPDTELRVAADQILRHDSQRMFVEEGGKLVGVITLTDVARALVSATTPSRCACEEEL